jgi:hypothetical protein
MMHAFTAIQSSLTCRIAFGDIISALPVPGTNAFVELFKRLKQFGLTAEKFSLETPTTRLSDVRVNLLLLQDTITLRVQYEAMELVVPTWVQGVEMQLMGVVNETLESFVELNPNVPGGFVSVQSVAHLRLAAGDPDRYMSERLSPFGAGFVSDAFALNMLPLPGGNLKKGRAVIARSIPFEGSLFVDYVAEYLPPEGRFSEDFVEGVRKDYDRRLAFLGLTPSVLDRVKA